MAISLRTRDSGRSVFHMEMLQHPDCIAIDCGAESAAEILASSSKRILR
jgi:hypothetical protein